MTGPARLTAKWRVLEAIVVAFVRVVRWRLDIRGLEHVDGQRGAVLAFNHHSYADFLMVAWPVVRQLRRPVRFLAKREVHSSPWIGWIVRWAEAVPVDRGSARARGEAYAAAIDALASGDLVAVAPEQTISPSFDLLPFRTGAVRMAQEAGVPIIPVIGWGSQRFATKGHRRRWATDIPVVVAYGEPIHVDPDAEPVAETQRVFDLMQQQLDEVQRSYPEAPGPGDDWWVPARLGGSAPDHAAVLRDHEERQRAWENERGAGHRREAS